MNMQGLTSDFYGVTYKEDVVAIKGSVKEILEKNTYKADLFSDLQGEATGDCGFCVYLYRMFTIPLADKLQL